MSNNRPICKVCEKPIDRKKDGMQQMWVVGHATSWHWDCFPDKAYNDRVEMVIEDAHSGSEDGVVEIGYDDYTKVSFKD